MTTSSRQGCIVLYMVDSDWPTADYLLHFIVSVVWTLLPTSDAQKLSIPNFVFDCTPSAQTTVWGGPRFHEGVPILPGKWGPGIPIFTASPKFYDTGSANSAKLFDRDNFPSVGLMRSALRTIFYFIRACSHNCRNSLYGSLILPWVRYHLPCAAIYYNKYQAWWD